MPAGGDATSRQPPGAEDMTEFLVLFAHHNMYFNMRFQELEAVASLLGICERDVLYVDMPHPTALTESPFALVRLPGEQAAHRLCERTVLVRAVLEVWGTGGEARDAVEQAVAGGKLAYERRRQFVAPPRTMQIRMTAFGKTMSNEDKQDLFEVVRPLFDGDEIVDLKDPATTIWVLEEHTHISSEKTHLGPRTSTPLRTYICRQVAGGRSIDKKKQSGEKAYFLKYELSQRAVLGPTTLDNELAFIMANCARVQHSDVVLEPFIGTGGIALAVSHFGARVFGGEIDIRVIKGWAVAYNKNKAAAQQAASSRGGGQQKQLDDAPGPGPGLHAAASCQSARADDVPKFTGGLSLEYLASIQLVQLEQFPTRKAETRPERSRGRTGAAEPLRDIFTNFLQYEMRSPEVVVCDNSRPPWRQVDTGWCDAIVTDPPYGVRAGSKKQGRNPDQGPVNIQDRESYIMPKIGYDEDELHVDLMRLATTALRDNGHLVYLVPVDLADFLGIDRAASERGGGPKGSLHGTVYPQGGRQKDARLVISETTRDPLLLDAKRYEDFIPRHADLEYVDASLQILSGGLGRLLVTMRRRPRVRVGAFEARGKATAPDGHRGAFRAARVQHMGPSDG